MGVGWGEGQGEAGRGEGGGAWRADGAGQHVVGRPSLTSVGPPTPAGNFRPVSVTWPPLDQSSRRGATIVPADRKRWAVALGAVTEGLRVRLRRWLGHDPGPGSPWSPCRSPERRVGGRLCCGGFVPAGSPSRIPGPARRPSRESWVVVVVSEAPRGCCLLAGLGKLPLPGRLQLSRRGPQTAPRRTGGAVPTPRGNAKPAVEEPLARDAAGGGGCWRHRRQ